MNEDAASTTAPSSAPVQKRLVLYVSGFDPRGPAHYHRLYRDQAELQSQVSGHRISTGRRERVNPVIDAWNVTANIEDRDVETRYEFLRWDDVIRTHWKPGRLSFWGLVVDTTWRSLRDGSLWRLYKYTMPGATVCFGPAVILLVMVLAAVLLLSLLASSWNDHGVSFWFAATAVLVLAGFAGLAWLAKYSEDGWYMGWTTRAWRFTYLQTAGEAPDMEKRQQELAQHLLQALKDPSWDEILLISHSFGTLQAVSIAARAERQQPGALADPRFAMLTLGQGTPSHSLQPRAVQFRQDIKTVADAMGERWIDITAPTDRVCTALTDPAEPVRGMDGLECASPKVLNLRAATLFEPVAYAKLKRDLFEMHFQYINATQLRGLYDFFAITAGPKTLAQRFATQKSVRDWREFERFGGPFPHLKTKA